MYVCGVRVLTLVRAVGVMRVRVRVSVQRVPVPPEPHLRLVQRAERGRPHTDPDPPGGQLPGPRAARAARRLLARQRLHSVIHTHLTR